MRLLNSCWARMFNGLGKVLGKVLGQGLGQGLGVSRRRATLMAWGMLMAQGGWAVDVYTL